MLAHFQEAHIGLSHADRWVWKTGQVGQFSVPSCYEIASNPRMEAGPWGAV